MSTESLKDSVRNNLASQHYMFVEDEWLSGCIEFLLEDTSNSYSESDIINLAKEQWLLNDLKDICPGSLPADLKNQKKAVLCGQYTLQINAAIDIGTPAYQQYTKLLKVNTENIDATTKFDDKVPNHRMIKLYLTDGVQEISAIEYKTMRNLSCDITPGCKVLIKGPVESRRGVLLLTESNIELLGGEVQEIAISNSLAGLLSAKLGLPMTQDTNTILNHPHSTTIPVPHDHMPPRSDYSEESNNSRPVARVTSVQLATPFADDDIDIDQIAEIEAQFDNHAKRPSAEDSKNPEKKMKVDIANTIDDYPLDEDLFPEPEVAFDEKLSKLERLSELKASSNSITNKGIKKTIAEPYIFKSEVNNKMERLTNTKASTSFMHQDLETIPYFEDEEYLRGVEQKMERLTDPKVLSSSINKGPKTVSSEPYIFIKQINELSDSDKAGRVFKVKGQIMKLLSKLSVGKDGWSLKCTIIDGSGSINVDFTSGVLSKLVGYTPQEMNQLKKQMATDPTMKEKAMSALQKARDALQVLNCIIELTILGGVPKITNLIPFEDKHLDLLRKRQTLGL